VRIRTLAEADLPAALDLFEAVVREGRWLATEPPVDRRETASAWRSLLETGHGTLLVADAGDTIAGLAVMVGRGTPELGMLVAEGWRRRGVGRALVDACVEWARAAGAKEIVLHVFPHNTAAVALYERHGFARLGVILRGYPRRSGERWDAIRMVKAL
jgi:ribosomal protein S18 acetylase RimI-like enzyme